MLVDAPVAEPARARARRSRRLWPVFGSLALAAAAASVWLITRPSEVGRPAAPYARLFTTPFSRDERPRARIERMLSRYAAPTQARLVRPGAP